MSKVLAIFVIGLWLAFALQSFAVESNKISDVEAAHYTAQANTWFEGTMTKTESDGSFVVRGAESPYARDYAAFKREYLSYPPAEREEHRQQLMNGYKNRLRYSFAENRQKDSSFTGGNEDAVAIFDEPQYGRDPSTWSIRAEPRAFQFSDLREGDRIAVGFDNYENNVFAIYLINPSRVDEIYIGPPDETAKVRPTPASP